MEGNGEYVYFHFTLSIFYYFSTFSLSIIIPLLWIMVFVVGAIIEKIIIR